MMDWKPVLLEALQGLNARVAAVFPRADLALPLVIVADEDGSVAAQADGRPYLEEYRLAADVYAETQAETEALACQVDAALSALGLRRTLQQDLYDESAHAWRKRLRYRALLRGDTVYQ